MTGRGAADVACRAIGSLKDALAECPHDDELSFIVWSESDKCMFNVMTWTVDAMNRTALATKDDVCMLRELVKALSYTQVLMRYHKVTDSVLYQLLVNYEDECVEAINVTEAAIRLSSDVATEVSAAPLHTNNVSWYGDHPRF